METPSEQLSKIIVKRLVDEKILDDEDGQEIQQKLVSGDVHEEDWQFAIESQLQREAQK